MSNERKEEKRNKKKKDAGTGQKIKKIFVSIKRDKSDRLFLPLGALKFDIRLSDIFASLLFGLTTSFMIDLFS